MDAMKVLSPLVAMCGTWDEANVEAWVEALLDLEHVTAAHDATRVTLQSWKQAKRPPYAIWLDSYKAAVQRGMLDQDRALAAPKGNEITLTEHLDGLLRRDDFTELGLWAHHADKWRLTDKDVRILGQSAQEWQGELALWFKEHPDWAKGATAAHQGEQRTFRFKRPIGEFIRDPEEER